MGLPTRFWADHSQDWQVAPVDPLPVPSPEGPGQGRR